MQKTKKSMLASGLAVLVCVAMLIGTTFAWFTDSVTNKGNKIQAGNLSIDATVASVDLNEGTYQIEGINGGEKFGFGTPVDLNNADPIISESNWEPGQSNAKLLTVTNSGSLAVKINLDFMVKDGGLTDALWFDFIQVKDDKATGSLTKRPMNSLTDMSNVEFSLKPEESISFILVYGMNEEAGNEYQGKSFAADVTILAKQDTVETDGFGNSNYDEDATYKTAVSDADGLTEAIAAGEPVKLEADVTLNTVIPVNPTGDTRIDLNGKKLAIDAGLGNTSVASGRSLTIENGTIESKSTKLDVIVNAGGEFTLKGCTYSGPGFQPEGKDATVNIIDSTVTSDLYCVSTNASVENGEIVKGYVEVNIINSHLTAHRDNMDNSGILFNVPGHLTIKDSTITADRQAVIVRGGTATIENSTLTTTGRYSGNNHLEDNWADGNEVPTAALVVGNRSVGAYQYPAECTLKNTKLVAESGAMTAYVYGISAERSAVLAYDAASSVGTVYHDGEGAIVRPE